MLGRTSALSALALVSVGCGSAPDNTTSSDSLNAANNSDVQVISAKSGGTVQWGIGGPWDATRCQYADREPAFTAEFTSRAKADCTEAFIAARGPAINRYVERSASIRETPNLTHVSFRHWCGEIEVVVAIKAAAFDSRSFEGIGFFADSRTVNEGEQRVFYGKDDPRLVRIGEATLKNEGHQRAYLYKFSGAGPCEPNGTGDNPSGEVSFKPYVLFTPEQERWENVPKDHAIRYRQSWDRRAELLD
jgi:hypothetical protein